jgi:ribonucleoside-triphosphate reductase (thioredoxin)
MRLIVKRDGSTVAFDPSKITRAVALAFRDAKKAAIGVSCEAPSFRSFVSWLRESGSEVSFGDKEGHFTTILEETFNGEKIPRAQQMRRLNRRLVAAGIDAADNGLRKLLDAAQSCAQRAAVNPADDPQRKALAEFPYGLAPQWWSEVAQVSDTIVRQIADKKGDTTTVEEAQNLAEELISRAGHFDVAKSYILYRNDREKERPVTYGGAGKRAISDLVQISKYARFNPGANRRETWEESVRDRVLPMHLRRYQGQGIDDDLNAAFEAVLRKEVLPSMRSMQFGGKAVEVNHSRMFNCAYTLCDRPAVFRESLGLLLAGCGVGYSVQKEHVAQLPLVKPRPNVTDLPLRHHEIADTIEGWCAAADELVNSYFDEYYAEFSYAKIRPKGLPLKTSGGKAPGHLPLKFALENVRKAFDGAVGRHLRPLEVHDSMCYLAEAVLSGGIRRSAMISIFSLDDEEMMMAKTGDWYLKTPWRLNANNSAFIHRDKATRQQFSNLIRATKEFGEPGFFFADNQDYGANPCCEIMLNPVVTIKENREIARLRQLGYTAPLTIGQRLTGFQMCNLTTVNASAASTPDKFYELCRHAAVIGTAQAGYTFMPALGPVTQFLNEREALLGVSICGIMDNPKVCLDADVLRRGAEVVKATNRRIAEAIGINPAARTTCVKPEGTTAQLLGTSSGVHPQWDKRYIRTMRLNNNEPQLQFFKQWNEHMTEPAVGRPNDTVINFPIEASPGAITRHDLTATDFLQAVLKVQQAWVEPGRAYDDHTPGAHHNVSNTCSVRPEEWDKVEEFIWTWRGKITGISLLPHDGDQKYVQAPYQSLTTKADVEKWNRLKPVSVDFSKLREYADTTSVKQSVACGGGGCDLI